MDAHLNVKLNLGMDADKHAPHNKIQDVINVLKVRKVLARNYTPFVVMVS